MGLINYFSEEMLPHFHLTALNAPLRRRSSTPPVCAAFSTAGALDEVRLHLEIPLVRITFTSQRHKPTSPTCL
jgi:hypothetical protein